MKLKRFYTAKETYQQNEETTCRMGESICKPCMQQGTNIWNLQGTQIAQEQ